MTVKTWGSIPAAIRDLYPREGHIGCGELALAAADEIEVMCAQHRHDHRQIERLERELYAEREAHAQLQARCFDGGSQSVFDAVKELRARLADEKSERLSRCGCGGKAVCGVCGRQLPNVAADETAASRISAAAMEQVARNLDAEIMRDAVKTAAPPSIDFGNRSMADTHGDPRITGCAHEWAYSPGPFGTEARCRRCGQWENERHTPEKTSVVDEGATLHAFEADPDHREYCVDCGQRKNHDLHG